MARQLETLAGIGDLRAINLEDGNVLVLPTSRYDVRERGNAFATLPSFHHFNDFTDLPKPLGHSCSHSAGVVSDALT